MSQENLEVVQRIYREVSQNTWQPLPELFDPHYEVDLTEAGPDLGVIPGADASENALRGYTETFDDFRIELQEVVHADERCVVASVRDGGRLKGSKSEAWNSFFHVWTFREGRILRRSSHRDRDKALEAAGLRE
jgi:ketosteroid isomerase-like protein